MDIFEKLEDAIIKNRTKDTLFRQFLNGPLKPVERPKDDLTKTPSLFE